MVPSRCPAGHNMAGQPGIATAGEKTFPLVESLFLVPPVPHGNRIPCLPVPCLVWLQCSPGHCVPTPGEPWPLPGMIPAVCAGITALCFHEVGSTGCAGRQRQLKRMQAPTTHLPHAQQQQQHPSLSLCSAQHPSSARQRLGRISSVKAPANPSAFG